jgi:predicted HTH transcriptional regulator
MAARDDQGVWRPTVAGLLMGSSVAHQFLPGAFIQAVAYQGTDVVPTDAGVYQKDAQDIVGPLDRQILDACAFVRKNMQQPAHKLAHGGREDLPQFDMLAVFEAVTNAVAHRVSGQQSEYANRCSPGFCPIARFASVKNHANWSSQRIHRSLYFMRLAQV